MWVYQIFDVLEQRSTEKFMCPQRSYFAIVSSLKNRTFPFFFLFTEILMEEVTGLIKAFDLSKNKNKKVYLFGSIDYREMYEQEDSEKSLPP